MGRPKKNRSSTSTDPKDPKSSIMFLDTFHHWFLNPTRPRFSFSLVDWIGLVLTTIVSFACHLLYIAHPAKVVFDEVYFGNFTHYYHNRTYFFDIHPPLGKQLLYLGSIIAGYSYKEIFSEINAPLNSSEIWRLRMWPAISGAFRAPFMFCTLKFLDVSTLWSLTVGIFVGMDQALIVESHYVLVDAYLSMFGSLTFVFCAILGRRLNRPLPFVVLAGVAAGATSSVKFTGCGVAVTLVLVLFVSYPFFQAVFYSAIATLSGSVVFFASFIAHFLMIKYPGPGCVYHHRSWCSDMARGRTSLFTDTSMLIHQMLVSNFAIQETHSYSSKWWQWPLMLGKGTYLWVDGDSQLWCIGSPIVWVVGFAGLIVWPTVVYFKRTELISSLWVVFGWAISYLPFSLIQRVMYNYHYFVPLLYSLVAGAVAMNAVAPKAVVAPVVLIAIQLVCYWVWFPITYGTDIPYEQLKKRMLPLWTY
jgi:dolichyl-phosphate-mannose-protein mannosyltransferase